MHVTKIYTPSETIIQFDNQDLELARQVLLINLNLKPHERFLVVTDPKMESSEAALWFEAGKTISPHTQMVVFEGMLENAQEPPSLVSLMLTKSHLALLQTTYSLSHTNARKLATQKGVRIASLPTVTLEMIRRTLSIDYKPIKDLSIHLKTLLDPASKVHLTSPAGTDITFDISHRNSIDDTGFYTHRGDFGNLPAGETFIAPLEGRTNGLFVVDGSFADIKLDTPISIGVKDGMVTNITGGKAATKLIKLLEEVGPLAKNIAELGIGTNPQANPEGSLIEAEKAYGTVHIALGNNATIGGTVNVPFHSDGVILSPTLIIDNQLILKADKFLL